MKATSFYIVVKKRLSFVLFFILFVIYIEMLTNIQSLYSERWQLLSELQKGEHDFIPRHHKEISDILNEMS